MGSDRDCNWLKLVITQYARQVISNCTGPGCSINHWACSYFNERKKLRIRQAVNYTDNRINRVIHTYNQEPYTNLCFRLKYVDSNAWIC